MICMFVLKNAIKTCVIFITTVPDEDRGFLIYEGIKQPKTIISRRWSTKRKIMVEIRAE